jgi:hypothetical protein
MKSIKDEMNIRVIKQYWLSELSRKLGIEIVESPIVSAPEDRVISIATNHLKRSISTYEIRGAITETKCLCNDNIVDICSWRFSKPTNTIQAVHSAIKDTYTLSHQLISQPMQLENQLHLTTHLDENQILQETQAHKLIMADLELIMFSNQTAITLGSLDEFGGYIDIYRLISFMLELPIKNVFPLI